MNKSVHSVVISMKEMRLFNRMNNLTLLGDCQNLVLSLIEMSGWRQEFEELLENYKTVHHVEEFLWAEQYNFEKIEWNLKSFEESLLKDEPEEEIDVDSEDGSVESSLVESDNPLFNRLRYLGMKHIEIDDGRELPEYDPDEEKMNTIASYFMSKIACNDIVNSMKDDVPGKENIVLRLGGVLLTLNQANSRCFRELLKWGVMTVDEHLLLVCSTKQIK